MDRFVRYFRAKIFPLEKQRVHRPSPDRSSRSNPVRVWARVNLYTPAALESRWFLYRSKEESNVFCSLPDHNPRGLVYRWTRLARYPFHRITSSRGSQDTSRSRYRSTPSTMTFLSRRSSYFLSSFFLYFFLLSPFSLFPPEIGNARIVESTEATVFTFPTASPSLSNSMTHFFLPFPRFYRYTRRTDGSSCLYSSILSPSPPPPRFRNVQRRVERFEEIFDFRRIDNRVSIIEKRR